MSKSRHRGHPTRISPRLPSLALYISIILAAGCASTPPAQKAAAGASPGAATAATPLAPVYPGVEWERVESPESVGWCSEGLERVRTELSRMNTTGLFAAVGGRVLFEHGDTRAISYLASVRKSVISILYGIHVERGEIDLDKTLADLGIDDNQGLTDAEKRARVRDLLTARSGVYHPASNPGDNLASAPPRGSKEPGEYYLYSNWDFNALGTIFEQETRTNIYDALEQELARPLGMQDFDRARQRKTGNRTLSRHLAYHMHISTRDMARIGYLMLRDGNWNGRQIVSSDWVRESTRAHTRVHEMNPESRRNGRFGYGYLWWAYDNPEFGPAYEGAYAATGLGGQYILVMPSHDLVVAHKTVLTGEKRVSSAQFHRVVDLLLQARCDPSRTN